MSHKILAVVTSTGRYEKVGYRTGLWLGELTHVLKELKAAGIEADIASPQGGHVPLDPESLKHLILLMGRTDRFYKDRASMDRLEHALPLGQVNPDDYDAIFLAGGHGTMFDFRTPELSTLVGRFADAGKPVAAVCHGPAGLLDATLADGTPLLRGKKVTGFSWMEEIAAMRADAVPFSLEKELGKAGQYEKATVPMAPHVVVDGQLITGQNPTSAKGVGQELVKALANHPA